MCKHSVDIVGYTLAVAEFQRLSSRAEQLEFEACPHLHDARLTSPTAFNLVTRSFRLLCYLMLRLCGLPIRVGWITSFVFTEELVSMSQKSSAYIYQWMSLADLEIDELI